MSQIVKQDHAISLDLMHALLSLLEKEWEEATTDSVQAKLASIATFSLMAFCGSLFRGPEVFLVFVCSGYLRSHGRKYQTVLLPNGLFTGVFSLSISHNYLGVLNMSRLTRYLEEILFPDYTMPGGVLPVLYGDAIFMNVNYSTILAKYDYVGNVKVDYVIKRLNHRMSGIWQSIELMYGAFFNLFSLFESKRHLKTFCDETSAYCLGVIGFFIFNCYACLNESACSSIFDSFAPTIQEYLPFG
jgi:hypothetical protein